MMTQMEGNRTFSVISSKCDNAWLTCVFTHRLRYGTASLTAQLRASIDAAADSTGCSTLVTTGIANGL